MPAINRRSNPTSSLEISDEQRWQSSPQAKRDSATLAATSAAMSVTRPVNPRLTGAIAANTMATANTLTVGRVEIVSSRPENPACQNCPAFRTSDISRPRNHNRHGQGRPRNACWSAWPNRPVDPAANHAAAMPATRITIAGRRNGQHGSSHVRSDCRGGHSPYYVIHEDDVVWLQQAYSARGTRRYFFRRSMIRLSATEQPSPLAWTISGLMSHSEISG